MSEQKSFQAKRKSVEEDLNRRKEAENKALKVVIRLMDGQVHPQDLIEAADSLNPQYYSDLTEERALALTCGYPLCSQKLQLKKHAKYHISTHTNKVYDMSERKNFCSGQCFKASKFFESQLSQEPLWARFAYPAPVTLLETAGLNLPDESVLIQNTLARDEDDSIPTDVMAELVDQLTLDSEEEVEPSSEIYQDISPKSAPPKTDSLLKLTNDSTANIQTLTLVEKASSIEANSSIKLDSIVTHPSKNSTTKPNIDGLLVRERKPSAKNHYVDNVDFDTISILKLKTAESQPAPAPTTHAETPTGARSRSVEQKIMGILKEWVTEDTRSFILKRHSEESRGDTESVQSPSNSDAPQPSKEASGSNEPIITDPKIPKVETQRRTIALRKLSTCLCQMSAHVPKVMDYTEHLRTLVKTFRLTSENISLQTTEWTYIAVFCLYISASCQKNNFHGSILEMIPVSGGPSVSKLIDTFDGLRLFDR